MGIVARALSLQRRASARGKHPHRRQLNRTALEKAGQARKISLTLRSLSLPPAGSTSALAPRGAISFRQPGPRRQLSGLAQRLVEQRLDIGLVGQALARCLLAGNSMSISGRRSETTRVLDASRRFRSSARSSRLSWPFLAACGRSWSSRFQFPNHQSVSSDSDLKAGRVRLCFIHESPNRVFGGCGLRRKALSPGFSRPLNGIV